MEVYIVQLTPPFKFIIYLFYLVPFVLAPFVLDPRTFYLFVQVLLLERVAAEGVAAVVAVDFRPLDAPVAELQIHY